MEILIRDYSDDDYDACRSLWGEMVQYHADIYGDTTLAGDDPGRGFDKYIKCADHCGTWVAVSEKKIIGFTGLLDTVGEEGVGEIEPVVVATSSRGEGTGTRLVEHVVSEAKKRKIRFLSISPVLRNMEAFDLYVRLGFNKVGDIELFQDLSPESKREWKSGIEIHGHKLDY